MLEQPIPNKMMTAPPIKKGWHFASDGIHAAEFIEAETLEKATEIYHKVKRALFPTSDTATVPPPQSTAAPETDSEKSVQ